MQTPPFAHELEVADVVGRLIEFWGFRRNMGRVWTLLYLSPDPLSADDLRQSLKLSSGAMSMTLTDLLRWGVVKRVWIQGERRDYFAPEVGLWKMISRVFRERERAEVGRAVEAFSDALARLRLLEFDAHDPKARARIALQRGRIESLLELARMGQALLEVFAATGRIDAAPLTRVFLGARRAFEAPPS